MNSRWMSGNSDLGLQENMIFLSNYLIQLDAHIESLVPVPLQTNRISICQLGDNGD